MRLNVISTLIPIKFDLKVNSVQMSNLVSLKNQKYLKS